MMKNIILISGYTTSGSSAVIDLMKEIKGVKVIEREFRILQDPDGLFDLEHKICTESNPLNSDIAIKRFSKFINTYFSNRLLSRRIGLNYQKHINPDYQKITDEFIKSITKFTYDNWWWYLALELDSIDYFSFRLKSLLNKIKLTRFKFIEKSYFPIYDRLNYLNSARKYISDLIDYHFDDETNHVVIDQASGPNVYSKALEYFENSKMIIVDRNLEDTKKNIILDNRLIGLDSNSLDFDDKFRYWYDTYRIGKIEDDNNKNTLIISFEDLVMNYEDVTKQIFDFLNIEPKNHLDKYKYFDPNKSKRIIGL